MNVDNVDFCGYDRNNKISLEIKVFLYSLVVGFFIVCLLVLMIILKKDLYYQNDLIITSNHSAVINVLKDDLNIIKNNKYLRIDNKNYYYEISSLELVNDIIVYYRVNLELESDLLVNSINRCLLLIRKESVFNYFIRIIKGG